MCTATIVNSVLIMSCGEKLALNQSIIIIHVEKVFHMNGGVGDASYHENSSLQKNAAERMKDITVEVMVETYSALRPESLGIADLGCSSGSNALRYIKMVVETLIQRPTALSELRLCVNDLPTNDFNTVFEALPNFYEELKKGKENISVLVAAYPSTFYGRVFPQKSLHFVFSFSSLHWLSRIPPGIYEELGRSLNRKSIYITKSTPPEVVGAYAKQFAEDFSVFLEGRSAEVVTGGRMVLLMDGMNSPHYFNIDNTFLWDILYQSFLTLVSKGRIKEEKVESYDVHYYEPCKQEIEEVLRKQGSFKLDRFEILEKEVDLSISGVVIAKSVRAVQESMISNHFEEGILDDLFAEYGKLLDKEMATKKIKTIHIAVVLTKL